MQYGSLHNVALCHFSKLRHLIPAAKCLYKGKNYGRGIIAMRQNDSKLQHYAMRHCVQAALLHAALDHRTAKGTQGTKASIVFAAIRAF